MSQGAPDENRATKAPAGTAPEESVHPVASAEEEKAAPGAKPPPDRSTKAPALHVAPTLSLDPNEWDNTLDPGARPVPESATLESPLGIADTMQAARIVVPSAPISGTEETLAADSSERPVVVSEGAYLLPVVDPRRYRVEGEFARGGLGRILRAQDATLGRPVAIKELLRSRDQAAQRFVREALVTARLQHPAIVPVYEAGHWPDGAPFFSMKLVSGRSLDQEISARVEFSSRLLLLPHVIAVCEAMAYSHAQGIIHRDLKPQNILVGDFGETVVIDWGLAKDLRAQRREEALPRPNDAGPGPVTPERAIHEGSSGSGLTIDGAVMGTPAYMPPEQASGRPVNERADVYALGAILYHLLSGRPPYVGQSSGEIVKRVVLGAPEPLEKAQPEVREDLAAIVAKAMARDAAERYPSAKELAEDLRRFQAGQLVGAHHYTPFELAARFVRKHRLAFGVLAAALLVLVVLSFYGVRQILRERDRANIDLLRAMGLAAEAEIESAKREQARREADARADQLLLAESRAAFTQDPTLALAWLKRLSLGATSWGAARILLARATEEGIARLYPHRAEVRALAVAPDGTLYTASGLSLRVWPRDGDRPHEISLPAPPTALALSPDGARLAVATSEGVIVLLQRSDNTQRLLPTHQGEVLALAFSPQGNSLTSAGEDGRVFTRELSDIAALPRLLPVPARRFDSLSYSADGAFLLVKGPDASFLLPGSGDLRFLIPEKAQDAALSSRGQAAVANSDGSFGLYSPPSYQRPERFSVGRAPLVALAFSPDGAWLAIADKNGEITRWEVASKRAASSFHIEGDVSGLVFSPDGASLAAITRQGGIFFSRGEGRAIALRGHQGEAHALAFSSDGLRLYSAEGTEVRGWFLPPLPTDWEGLSQAPRTVAFSPEGGSLAASSEAGEVAVWNLAQPSSAPSVLLRHEKGEAVFAFSPDGRLLASGGADQVVRLTGVSAGAGQTLNGHTGAVRAIAFSQSGEWLASGDEAGQVMLWPVVCVAQSGADACAAPFVLGEKTGAVRALAFSPQQTLLASGGDDGRVHLWDPLSGSERALTGPDGSPGMHADRVLSLDFTADGRWLLSLGADGVVWIWSVETGRGSSLLAHGQEITRFATAPERARFLSGGSDKLLRLWEIDEQGFSRELRSFAGHEAGIVDIAFSPEGEGFVSSDELGGLRQWDAASGESRTLMGRGQVAGLAISPDGTKIAAGGVEEASVWVYPDPLPRGALGLSAWMALATNAEIDADNRLSVRRVISWWSGVRSSLGGAGWLFPAAP